MYMVWAAYITLTAYQHPAGTLHSALARLQIHPSWALATRARNARRGAVHGMTAPRRQAVRTV